MRNMYHVTQNSFYLQLSKLRYRGNGYSVFIVDYYYKSSGTLFATEKSVRIYDSVRAFWEVWDESAINNLNIT